MRSFATKHGAAYRLKERELAACFEIGCFLNLVRDYERQRVLVTPRNLKDNEFRYLTTPAGIPDNFSHVDLELAGFGRWELRQQIRIASPDDPDIYFTPDIVVLREGRQALGRADPDYAGGKKRMFAVQADAVVAFHECKSLIGFPELFVSFAGMTLTAHADRHFEPSNPLARKADGHLASTLFVGGAASNLHLRMVSALEQRFAFNIITGVHQGKRLVSTKAKNAIRIPF